MLRLDSKDNKRNRLTTSQQGLMQYKGVAVSFSDHKRNVYALTNHSGRNSQNRIPHLSNLLRRRRELS